MGNRAHGHCGLTFAIAVAGHVLTGADPAARALLAALTAGRGFTAAAHAGSDFPFSSVPRLGRLSEREMVATGGGTAPERPDEWHTAGMISDGAPRAQQADRVSRRGFLLGAGALAGGAAVAGLAGCSGGSTGPGTGPATTRRRAAAGPVQTSGYLDSRYTHARMGWTISVPGGGQRPRAIVYCLHGKGGDHRMAFDHLHIPEVADRLGLPLAVAGVDGGTDSYWHRRANGTDALAMLLKEFMPLARARVGSLPQAIIGWSMGGYGALLAAERARHQFHAVAPASPAIWLAPGDTAPGAFDSPADFYANDVFTGVHRLRKMRVAVFCGTSDPFYVATRHLVSLMDFPHEARFGPGGHTRAYWQGVAPAQLRAIARAPGIGLIGPARS